tara:strand:- start:335 stop:589 length:255 start_codon:yes stop_codon:yes gene_type:complete
MLVVRCRECQKELTSHETKSQSCGCPNMMTVKGDSVTALDLSRVVMISSSVKKKQKDGVLSDSDLMFQEERRKRKVRKMNFEIK